MQLDRTNVVIRARTLSEIGDLALILIRCYPKAAVLGFLVGALPWMLANTLLLGWIPLGVFMEGVFDEEASSELYRYYYLLITLVILQTPIAGAVTTSLIGRAVFEAEVGWRSTLAELRSVFWRVFWVLGVVRGPIPLMLILATNLGGEFALFREGWLPAMFLLWAAFTRSRRPFMPEILILEKCPLSSRTPQGLSALRRSASLHKPLVGELVGRFLTVGAMLFVLYLAVSFALMWGRGVLFNWWDHWSPSVTLFFEPISLWAVAGLSVLVRFLSYLDSRIRLEGWEVDLAIRAETERQFGAGAQTAPQPPAAKPSPIRDRRSGDNAGKHAAAKRAAKIGAPAVLVAALWAFGHAAAAGEIPLGAAMPVTVAAADANSDAAAPADGRPFRAPSTHWYDAEQDRLRPVPVRTRLPEAGNRDSRWLPAPERVRRPAGGGTTGGGGAGTGPVAQALGWIALAVVATILIGTIIYLFTKAEPDVMRAGGTSLQKSGSEAVDEQTLQRIEELPAEVRVHRGNLRAEAERLMNEGRFAEAIVLLFGHQLLLLDRAGMLRLSRGKTNGRYLREVRAASSAAHQLFARTVTAFEASYFGGHHPSAARFARLWEANEKLERGLQSRMESAA